jgi:predicted transposase/invertase (TIGR01784 family)
MTELILGRKIGSFAEAEPQKTIRLTADGHGVRFDVYFEDDQDTVFDIEMHQWSVQHLAKRTRYYQGMIDLNMLEKGIKYENLKNSYIVFITLDNPYEEIGLHKYRFRNICMEEPCLEMGDGAEKVFLCANGTRDDVSDEIQAFLQYVAGEKPTTEITKKLDRLVLDAREHKEWRLEYMTLLERDEKMREEGHHVAFDVDVVGGTNVKKFYGDDALSIFIQAPSIDALRERLVGRQTDSMEEIEKRLAKADWEMNFAKGKFDITIINNDLETAKRDILEAVQKFIEK